MNNLVGMDVGKPGGDMTAITARCPKCQRVYTLTYEPSPIVMQPIELQCKCGEVTSLRGVTGRRSARRSAVTADANCLPNRLRS